MKSAFIRGKSSGRVRLLVAVCLIGVLYALVPRPALAAAEKPPIRIGVIAAAKTSAGKGTVRGAKLAAAEINDAGGVNGRPIKLIVYEDQLSASVAVRDFQRLVQQDKVSAVIGLYASEVALAVEPWAARLKTPLIVTNAASPEVSERVHDSYDQYKYVFTMLPNSILMARTVCDFTRHTLADKLGAKHAVTVSEDAKWTQDFDKAFAECLPDAGVDVDDQIRFSMDTNDFTPIFNRVESHKPDLIVTGLAHTGLRATVQWANSQVPSLMVGMNVVAMSQGFWKQSNGTVQGVITLAQGGPNAILTPKTKPYREAFIKRFGDTVGPGLGVPAYDALHILSEAMQRAGSTDADALVDALEKTDHVGAGSVGHIRFRGPDSRFTHDSTFQMTILQWQNGKRVPVWPPEVARPVILPDFVSLKASGGGS